VVVDLRRFEHALSNASENALVLQVNHAQLVRLILHRRSQSSQHHRHRHKNQQTFIALQYMRTHFISQLTKQMPVKSSVKRQLRLAFN